MFNNNTGLGGSGGAAGLGVAGGAPGIGAGGQFNVGQIGGGAPSGQNDEDVYGGFNEDGDDPYNPNGGAFGEDGYDFDNSTSYNMNVNSASVRAGLPTTPAVNLGRPNTGANRMGMGTAMGRGMMGTAAGGAPLGTGAGRLGTGAQGAGGELRPMTSMQGAGYSSSTRKVFDPMGQGQARGAAPPLQKRSENSPEDLCRELERQVNILIEESSIANHQGQKETALEKAKEAGKRERQLCREREKNGLSDQINSDLTYAVCFNLANQYDACGMHTEALNTYSLIVKDKNYPNAGRLRVNMGNIYFSQQKYPNAIKMYRMAMDQVPTAAKEIRFRILRNIGIAFIKLGQFQDAIEAFEQIMETLPDFQAGFNLILCYYALGDKEKQKKGFANLIGIRQPQMDDAEEDSPTREQAALMNDDLLVDLRERQKKAESFIALAAKLIAPGVEKDLETGFNSIIEQLKTQDYPHLASELEMTRAVAFLKKKDFEKATELFKILEKKDHMLASPASNNLSFLYFLQGDYSSANKYAQAALKAERYNAKALVNRGNCYYAKEKYVEACKYYMEAVQAEVDCTDAIYNLGMAQVKMKEYASARKQFDKLLAILPDNPDALFQIAQILEIQADGDARQIAPAREVYKRLHGVVPTDPRILAKLGSLYNMEGDEPQAFYYHELAYRHYPVDMDVISWLGAYYVKMDVYEKAIGFFERAGQIEPFEVKWQLMIASCHRRAKNTQKAFDRYKEIERNFPDTVECLKYLISCAEELNLETDQWKDKLTRALKKASEKNSGNKGEAFDNLPSVERAPQGQSPPQQYNQAPMGGGMGGGMGGSMGGGMSSQQNRTPPQQSMQRQPVHMGDVGVDMRQKGQSVKVGSKTDDLDFSGDELDDDLLPGM